MALAIGTRGRRGRKNGFEADRGARPSQLYSLPVRESRTLLRSRRDDSPVFVPVFDTLTGSPRVGIARGSNSVAKTLLPDSSFMIPPAGVLPGQRPKARGRRYGLLCLSASQ